LGDPVERAGGAEVVFAETLLDVSATIAPGAALLDDPRRESGRRVVERMRDRLRLGALEPHVAGFVIDKVAVVLEPALFARPEVLGGWPAAGEEAQRYR